MGEADETSRLGHVQEFGRTLLRPFAAAVVTSRRLHVGVAGEVLPGGDVGTGVEQVAHEGAPQVMG